MDMISTHASVLPVITAYINLRMRAPVSQTLWDEFSKPSLIEVGMRHRRTRIDADVDP